MNAISERISVVATEKRGAHSDRWKQLPGGIDRGVQPTCPSVHPKAPAEAIMPALWRNWMVRASKVVCFRRLAHLTTYRLATILALIEARNIHHHTPSQRSILPLLRSHDLQLRKLNETNWVVCVSG